MEDEMYLYEYQLFDGDAYIIFNIVGINYDATKVKVAITNRGKISVVEYELFEDKQGKYFEYGSLLEKVYLDDFEDMEGSRC